MPQEPSDPNAQNQGHWDACRNKPRKVDSGSAEESKFIDIGIKVLKVFTVIFTFTVVLGCAVVSKGTLLFMTSQIKKNTTRSYCNKDLDLNKRFIVSLPEEERVVWIWLIIFAFMVPELGTFIRSIRILLFKNWNFSTQKTRTTRVLPIQEILEFFWLFITESLPTIGSAFLVFIVLPELDVIKGAMLTNAVCFVPGLVAFFSRKRPNIAKRKLIMILDIAAIAAQASAFVVWPLIDGRPVLYFIPASLLLISFGWWENFISEKSSISFIVELAKDKKEFKNKTYFMYSILAPWKCLLFLITTIVIFKVREGNLQLLFNQFLDGFRSHGVHITEVVVNMNLNDAASASFGTTVQTSLWTPLTVWLINISATYVCYAFGKFACKIMIHSFSFAFPISLSVPILLTALIAMCGKYNQNICEYKDVIPPYLFFNVPSLIYLNNFIAHQHAWIWLVWLLSQTWITIHIWTNNNDKLASTEKLFFKPMYDAYLIDQSMALNRRRIRKNRTKLSSKTEEEITRIYACGTMWHETKEEMVIFIKSILRMDEDQCAHRIVRTYLEHNLRNYYEFETHILFDDAFILDDQGLHVNQHVNNLIEAINTAALDVHRNMVKIKRPVIYPAPYGGRLEWTLPGKTNLTVHLKDARKVRRKKRWSQVMYMYYLLGHRIMENEDYTADQIAKITQNTYLLALDGDVDFQPQAVHLLVDLMKRNKTVGAACGRIHPVGEGFMAWYQTFEYCIGHWLQKATEHVIGCVLCSPGCFSLFRAKALMDDNVMAKYTTLSEKARHFIQYDQGEDRWLCTLLLQKEYRVEYCAASDAYTHCPEGLNEFYNQRRRWMPSTIANIMDLLTDAKHIVKVNENISKIYILYQGVLMVGTVIGPGTIFLMLVGGFSATFDIGQWSSLLLNIIPVLIFITVCATCRTRTQLFFAGVISAVYGLIMMAVLVGVMLQIQDDGWLAPSSLFFFCIMGEFIVTALLHPREFYCLKYGIIYYVTVPSMYVLLVIYCAFNMNNVSWGTREATIVKPQAQDEDNKEEKQPEQKRRKKHKIYSFFGNNKDNAGSFEFSCAGLFKFICCTHQADGEESQILKNMQASLLQVQQKLEYIEHYQLANYATDSKRTEVKRKTTFIEGYRASVKEPKADVSSLDHNEENDDYSFVTPSDNGEDSWFYEGELGRSEVTYLQKNEEKFWDALINKYLYPANTYRKEEVTKELKDLRDRMVITFLMLNSLFVLVIFLLTLKKDVIYVNWPIAPKINFTYSTGQNEIYVEKTYLQLEPIGFVFLIFFVVLMVIQMLAMLYHRFGTFSHIMATIAVKSDQAENLAEELVQTFKKIQRKADDDEEAEVPLARRDTVHALALNRQKKVNHVIEDLDEAFTAGMEKLNNRKTSEDIPDIPRKTMQKIRDRRDTIVQRRMSQMPRSSSISRSSHMGNNIRNGGESLSIPRYEGKTSA